MAKNNGIADYRERLERVRSHIRDNLDGPLNLDDLADIACLSRFHWHRTYRGLTGETVWQTVRRMRLHRAAAELANGTLAIEQIVARSGYTNSRAFSQAFKADYGLPPLRYRAEGGHRRYENPEWQESDTMYDVRIEEMGPAKLVGFEHTGPYMEIGSAFEKFYAEVGPANLASQAMAIAAAYFSDPDITAPEECRSLAGMIVSPDLDVAAGFDRFDIPPGRYAVLQHKGAYAELPKAYQWFYGAWLADSGESAAAAPAVEKYLNSPMNTAPAELVTEICMPLA